MELNLEETLKVLEHLIREYPETMTILELKNLYLQKMARVTY